jgi:hypothetical protein
VSWVGHASADHRAAVIGLGHVPEPEQKGHLFAVVSAIVVLATIGAAAYGLGWFSSAPKQPKETPAVATTGSSAPIAAPAPQGSAAVTPSEPLPEISEVVIDSAPPGATIVALPDHTTIGQTPHTLTLLGSATVRRYKLALAGYADVTIDVIPNKATVELKPRLVRAQAAAESSVDPRKPRATPTAVNPNPSTAVTKPDVSTAVTKPDVSTAVTKPDTAPTEKPAAPSDEDDAPEPAEPPKPATEPTPP